MTDTYDIRPERLYGTRQFAAARAKRMASSEAPSLLRRTFSTKPTAAAPFNSFAAQTAHYDAVRARLSGGIAPARQKPVIRIVRPEPEPVPKMILYPYKFGPPKPCRRLPEGLEGYLTTAKIINACAAFYGVTVIDIFSHARTSDVVKPRQIAMYLSKTLALRSFLDIGRRFGGRDHTTVMHAVRKITALIENGDTQMKAEIDDLTAILIPPNAAVS